MQGSSRAAVAAGQQALDALVSGAAGASGSAALAEDLFGIGAALDSSVSLRRALTDPTRDAGAKGELVRRLLTGKAGAQAIELIVGLVSHRWSSERDLTDTIENFAVQALVSGAEAGQRADQIEDELFRFERIVAGNRELRDSVGDRRADSAARAAMVDRLLTGKAQPETVRLARQAVLAPRGRRFDRVVDEYLGIIATRRSQLSATVTTAVDLDATQRERLVAALTRIYDKQVHLNVVIDPTVVGGIRVEIGDEVLDGTIARKLEGARRHFGS